MSAETDKTLQLGENLIKLLESSGVTNLKLEEDGFISGDINSEHFKKLTFEVEGDFIHIKGTS